MPRKLKKVNLYLVNGRSGLVFFSTDLGFIFGSNVGKEFGVMLSGKGLHQPEFACDIVHIDPSMIYIDLIEHNVVGNTRASLFCCFLFVSKLKARDLIASGQCMKYRTFSYLQFKPLLKNSFHSIHIHLRHTSSEKNPLCLLVSLVWF